MTCCVLFDSGFFFFSYCVYPSAYRVSEKTCALLTDMFCSCHAIQEADNRLIQYLVEIGGDRILRVLP